MGTYGFGLGLPIGHVAGVRYDFASQPEGAGSSRLDRHAVTSYIDPIELVRLLR